MTEQEQAEAVLEGLTRTVPKLWTGETCPQCEDRLREGEPYPEVLASHENCHGWMHCGPECCGTCDVCGA